MAVAAGEGSASEDEPAMGSVREVPARPVFMQSNSNECTSGNRSTQSLLFGRCVEEYEAGLVKQAVVLLKAAVGYKWFRSIMRWPVWFLWERLAFVRPAEREQGADLRALCRPAAWERATAD
ncbi:hypothetical protein TSOC_006048 [Tetrabaena socialis]|uniref:Uncharacterized protein n=1 Tax=Tetrabaena socialis TaxID=47790 RepID=A0A2J8A4Q8_9CHLO|nr:hypothetical protein TSOC_006048 [Tetrabaena socialis]|eukprot:PNH07498.1 hypothetical protein TSOC_006048 [Tetrabaena socialis]